MSKIGHAVLNDPCCPVCGSYIRKNNHDKEECSSYSCLYGKLSSRIYDKTEVIHNEQS